MSKYILPEGFTPISTPWEGQKDVTMVYPDGSYVSYNNIEHHFGSIQPRVVGWKYKDPLRQIEEEKPVEVDLFQYGVSIITFTNGDTHVAYGRVVEKRSDAHKYYTVCNDWLEQCLQHDPNLEIASIQQGIQYAEIKTETVKTETRIDIDESLGGYDSKVYGDDIRF